MSTLDSSSENAIEQIACPQSQSGLYDVLYKSLVDLNTIPTEKDLQDSFERSLEARPDLKVNHEELLELTHEFYQILLSVQATNSQELLEKLTALEIGNQTTEESKQAQNELKRFQEKWDKFATQQDMDCPSATPVNPTQPVTQPPANVSNIVIGARKVLVTAYQSCEAIALPPMTKSTPSVEGISRVGTHADGVGAKRAISDLQSLLKTDYYLQNYKTNSACQDIRSNPPIYDYGGKPSASSDASSALDFFTNAGSGTTVRGVDCSAYVFSAVAAGGLRLSPGKKLKAILVNGISSTMYMDPANNGMTCFDKVKMGVSSTLKAGDIAAIKGHVILIDSVGSDPFGIAKIQNSSQCSSLTIANFDFVVAQSSPSKNGIGINRYRGQDYLSEEPTLRTGFEAYARQACTAKFQNKDVAMTATNFQIIRHNQSATCRDNPVALVGESCAKACSSL